MKIIDIYEKVAKGEEVPRHIKIGDSIYHFDCSDSDYYNDIENAPSLLERIWRNNAYVWLNLSVEILEEVENKEYEDIEELSYAGYTSNTHEVDKELYYIRTINALIRNQKYILEQLNKESK